MKSVHTCSFSGPHFPASWLNTDQKNSAYGHFLRIGDLHLNLDLGLHMKIFSIFNLGHMSTGIKLKIQFINVEYFTEKQTCSSLFLKGLLVVLSGAYKPWLWHNLDNFRKSLEQLLCKLCQNTCFIWPVFYCIRTILCLYTDNCFLYKLKNFPSVLIFMVQRTLLWLWRYSVLW